MNITPLSDKAASRQRSDYGSGTLTDTVKVDVVDTYLVQDCNTAQRLPFEEFAIKILRLPEDWKATWSAKFKEVLDLPEWATYKKTWYEDHNENALYRPFAQLCNKAIATMTGGQNCTGSLVVYAHDKAFQIGYTIRAPDTAFTLWGWAERAGGKLDDREKKTFVGFDNKGLKKLSWEQIRMFQEVKSTANGRTLGGPEFLSPKVVKRPPKVNSSQTSSGATSSGSRKRGLDSVTGGQTSTQGTQKRQRNSKSVHTSGELTYATIHTISLNRVRSRFADDSIGQPIDRYQPPCPCQSTMRRLRF
ncbi:hypothetical protein L218DRAFT_657148 [Marasmius fiardii PR-910]|nr:hypothetical protein L218DRAFT_657148 [Marasmius fiardii PR-910]